jgi:carboxyl-terminal processing protease
VDLVRDEVKLEEKAAKGEVREVKNADGAGRAQVGVITLPDFYADMKGRFATAPTRAAPPATWSRSWPTSRSEGVHGIILDLRSNGGGSLADCHQPVRLLHRERPRGAGQETSAGCRSSAIPSPPPCYTGKPLIVLVNKLSASASEILAAALQDYGRALIVGDSKTHGKGTVQTLSTLAEGLRLLRQPTNDLGSVKLTTASFYRIAGGSTQLNGVKPDIIISSPWTRWKWARSSCPTPSPGPRSTRPSTTPCATSPPWCPSLREASAKRRLKDSTFAAYEQIVARVAERQKTSEISLNYDERLALARSEKELEKLLKEQDAALNEPAAEGNAEKKGPDPVLAETLRILADLVNLDAQPGAVTAAAGGPS